jgi:multidrug resistance protein EbrA
MVLLTPMNTTILSNIEKNKNAVIAGVLFALGNLFWIYSISTKTSIGSIRTIMAGFETALLFLVGYLLFSETFDVKKIIGIIMVLLGIYLIG